MFNRREEIRGEVTRPTDGRTVPEPVRANDGQRRPRYSEEAIRVGQRIVDLENTVEEFRQRGMEWERRALLAEDTSKHLRERIEEEHQQHREEVARLRFEVTRLQDELTVMHTKMGTAGKLILECLNHTIKRIGSDEPIAVPAAAVAADANIEELERMIIGETVPRVVAEGPRET